jgi:phenylacetate-CoA ligase
MGNMSKAGRSTAAKAGAARKVASKRGAAKYKFDAAAETMPRDELARLQLRRLKTSLKNAYDNVAFHRRRMKALGFEPGDLKRLEDLAGLPFTLKSDLRDHYPFGLFARPQTEVMRLHASSGTTGKPTVVGYTGKDIATWAALMARSLACAGARPGNIIHNAYGYGLFTGGLGAHYGAERLGATVVPMSGGSTERQIVLITDFGARVLCATPSYALAMAEVAEKGGVDLRKSKLEIGVFGAEPWSEGMRREVQERLGLKAVDIYGLSEIMGPGVACECEEAQAGLHAWEDHFIFEVIDPDTGKALKEGEAGELVITTLTKEALPMIRYRTRDITRLSTERCACGRTHLRIKRITGRNDDMLIIRGVNVYPSQIESVLVGLPDVAPHYQLVVERKGTLDHLTVEVEMVPNVVPTAELRAVVGESVRHHIKSIIGVTADVVVKEPGEIPRSMGKAVRVRDQRPKLS